METNPNLPSALCITGMSRSGTSVVTSLLQSGGLHVGRRLLGPGTGNIKGHFEDLDFYQFHQWVLEAQGVASSGFTLQRDLQIREQHVLHARALIAERRAQARPWGWKDPRTTLFLDFWGQLIPEVHFLILYRCPWDVVDSLFRRGDVAFRSNPSFAVQVWIHYNRLLIDFHDRFPERCLCVNSYRAVSSPHRLREALLKKFGLNLSPPDHLYETSLFHSLPSSRWASLLRHHFPEAEELYEQLNQRADRISLEGEPSLAAEPPSFVPAEDWALQDWLQVRILEEQLEELRVRLETSEAELAQTRDELVQKTAACDALRDDLDEVKEQLELSQTDLSRARMDFVVAQQQTYGMESSKFWKMRKAWMRVKNCLRRAG
jgi:hypothetical protein